MSKHGSIYNNTKKQDATKNKPNNTESKSNEKIHACARVSSRAPFDLHGRTRERRRLPRPHAGSLPHPMLYVSVVVGSDVIRGRDTEGYTDEGRWKEEM